MHKCLTVLYLTFAIPKFYLILIMFIILDNLRRLLSLSRTTRSVEKSVAQLLEDGRIQITKKVGKTVNEKPGFLTPYEALYLMETVSYSFQNNLLKNHMKTYSILSFARINWKYITIPLLYR